MVSRCCLIAIFLITSEGEQLFQTVIDHLAFLFCELPASILCLHSTELFLFSFVICKPVCLFWMLNLCVKCDLQPKTLLISSGWGFIKIWIKGLTDTNNFKERKRQGGICSHCFRNFFPTYWRITGKSLKFQGNHCVKLGLDHLFSTEVPCSLAPAAWHPEGKLLLCFQHQLFGLDDALHDELLLPRRYICAAFQATKVCELNPPIHLSGTTARGQGSLWRLWWQI